MAAPMGPPMLPSFSLRVQLFAADAHGSGDRPIRCFRVVIGPDATIREFCQEASRIHEINYGQPIAIKKCQDDQEFDVTQGEIVGSLFASAATIRVVQASSTPTVRDSVPPDSALRYDPAPKASLKRRRERGSSVRPNGVPSSTWNSNKRQRLLDLDPDLPIPSCERDLQDTLEGQIDGEVITIPDSQQSTGRGGYARGEVPGTVSPPPSRPVQSEKKSTEQQRHKPAAPSVSNAPSANTQGRAAPAPARSKSASYHIERATERGTSVSTAATSPLSADQHPPLPPGRSSAFNKRVVLPSQATNARINGKPSPKPTNLDTVYDEIESDSGGSAAILERTKASLKVRSSPLSADGGSKFNTPPNGSHRNSRGSDVPPSELPLTPNSKQREDKKQRAEEAKKSRIAAAEAAEQRKREAEERQAAEAARLKKAEQEKEAAEKRANAIATATRLEKERVEKIEREKKAEEERVAQLLEEAKLKEAKERAEKLEQAKQATIEKRKLVEARRIAREKVEAEAKLRKEEERKRIAEAAAAEELKKKAMIEEQKLAEAKEKADAEAERLRKEEQKRKRVAEAAAAEELRKSKDTALAEPPSSRRKSSTASVDSTRSGSQARSSLAPKPQSSTPFIPSGRKSALKSSHTTTASSPMPAQRSPSATSVGSSQMQPPNDAPRRVSFNIDETPIRPVMAPVRPDPTPIRPPKTPKSSKLQEVPPEKQSHTPILPPSAKVFPKEKQTTPILPPKLKSVSKTPPPTTTPRVTVKSASPVPIQPPKKSETPRSTAPKGKAKSAETAPVPDSAADSSESPESEVQVTDKINPVDLLNATVQRSSSSSLATTKPGPDPNELDDEEQDDDVDMISRQSTPPDTRSPVIFNKHSAAALAPVPTLELSKAAEEEVQSADESSSSGEESGESSEEEDEDEELSEEAEEEEPSAGQAQPSSLDLPRAQPNSQSSVSSVKQKRKNQAGPSDRESSTQDAIDFQLTSSLYEARTSSPSRRLQKLATSTPLPSSPSTQRPVFKIGASLAGLNATKDTAGRNQANGVVHGSSLAKSIEAAQSGSESEESDSASDSESEVEDTAAKAFDAQLSQARAVPLPDSDSDSNSDEDSEEETKQTMRKELATKIARKTGSGWKGAPGTSKKEGGKEKSRIAGRDIAKAEKKKRENKYLTGYSFSQIK